MGKVWQKWAWSPKIFRRAPRALFQKNPPSLIPGSAPAVLLHHSRTLLYICTVRCLTCMIVHSVCSSPLLCCAVLQCVFSIAFILRAESNLAQLLANYVTQEFICFTGLYVTNMISPVKFHILKHLQQETMFSPMAHGCMVAVHLVLTDATFSLPSLPRLLWQLPVAAGLLQSKVHRQHAT